MNTQNKIGDKIMLAKLTMGEIKIMKKINMIYKKYQIPNKVLKGLNKKDGRFKIVNTLTKEVIYRYVDIQNMVEHLGKKHNEENKWN